MRDGGGTPEGQRVSKRLITLCCLQADVPQLARISAVSLLSCRAVLMGYVCGERTSTGAPFGNKEEGSLSLSFLPPLFLTFTYNQYEFNISIATIQSFMLQAGPED